MSRWRAAGGWLRCSVAACGMLLAAAAAAAAGPAEAAAAAEHARIAAERQAVEARFARAQAECRQRFLVTDCLEAARAERRAALAPLQRQRMVLDDARRRERAAERLRAIQARARTLDTRAEAPSAPLRRQPRKAPAAAPTPAGAAAAAGSASAAAAAAPASAAALRQARPAAATPARRATPEKTEKSTAAAQQAQRQRDSQQQREQAALAHAEAVRQRNARQDAKRPPAAGLPVPATSAPAR